jgi:diacylglycerol kinase family enzyme
MNAMHYSSLTILYNPKSTGDSKANAESFQKALADKGIKGVKLIATKHRGHAEELAYGLAKASDSPLIISSSGDGGYSEVVNGALRAQAEGANPTTCVLPSGNANDHYKQLHQGDTVDHIVSGRCHHIDVLTITAEAPDYSWKRYAHSYVGFGVTPEIGQQLNEAELNAANEVIISIKSLLKSKPFTIKRKGKKQESQSIVMSNIAKMSKVFGLAKSAKVNDGLFEVFELPASKPFMFGVIVKSATVGLRYTEQTDHYDLTTIAVLPVQCDGEVFDIPARATVRIGIEQQALACIV